MLCEVYVQAPLHRLDVALELGVVGKQVKRKHNDNEKCDDEGLIVRNKLKSYLGVLDVLFQQGVRWPYNKESGKGQTV